MKRAILLRQNSTNEGTLGLLRSEGFSIYTIELPWRDNVKTKSCIPTGLYQCNWIRSPKFGLVYRVDKVEGRSGILFHGGNFAGNTDLGYLSHSHGCIILGNKTACIDNQKAVLNSRTAVRMMNEYFNKESFLLEIKNVRDLVSTL